MGNIRRKAAVGIAALAGALLGLEKIGGVAITPGERTDFAWSYDPSDSSVVHLRSDGGNLSAWIDLHVEGLSGRDAEVSARLPGRVLHVRLSPGPQNRWHIEISRTDSMPQEQFSWRSGQTIELSADGARTLTIVDWAIHTDEGRDSKGLAGWRTLWFYLLAACTVIGIVWAVTTAVKKEQEPSPLLVEEQAIATVKDVIAATEGKDAEETQRIRRVLKAVALDATDPAAAVTDALPDNATPAQKLALQRRTAFLFTKRMDTLIRLLYRFRESVRPR